MTAKPSRCQMALGASLVVAALVGVGQLHAQTPTSVTLLRRMAEVADGRRSVGPVFVVLADEFPHEAGGVFLERREADSVAAALGIGWRVHGPILPAQDDPFRLSRVAKCVHLQSVMNPRFGYGFGVPLPEPPVVGTAAYCPGSPFVPLSEVDSITIGLYGPAGSHTSTYDPRHVDAVFFSLSAIEKFAIPYYTRVLGVDLAAVMQAEFARLFREGR